MNSVLDYFNRKDKPSLLLLNPSSEPLASLGAAYNVSSTLRFSGISELSFTYPMSIDNGKTNTPGYDSIQNKMIVELEGVGKYIISESPESSDGSTPVKNIIAQSFESELLYKRIVGLSGTSIPFIDISLSPASIMGKVAKLAPSWDIGEVDEELYDMYRSFDVGNNTIYNFLTSDVAKAFGCVFTFNTFLKTISAKLIKNLEDHTGGFISLDNVGRSIAVNEYSDELCTALTCYGGTDLDIRRVNPLGTNTIYNFDYYINNNSNNQWMSQGLKDKLKDWKTNLRNNEQLYRDITLENNMTIEEYTSISQLIVEYQSTLDSLQVTLEGLRAIPTKTEDEEARATRLAEIDKTLIDIANTQIAIRKARSDKSLKRQEIDNNNARLRVITNGLKFSGEYSWQSLSDFMVSFISNFSNIASDWKSIIFETADNLEVDVPQFSESVPSIEDAIYYISSDLEALYIDISENLRKYWYLTDNDRQRTIAHISNTNEKIINLCYMFDNLISNTDMAINLRSEAKELWSYGDIIDDTYENSSYLTREQYEELQYFIFDNTYTNNNIITTDIMTEEEVQEQALALYDQSVDVLSRASNPRYEISGDFISILNTPEFSDLVDKVDLGKQVTVELPNGNNHVDVTLLEMAYNYDSPDSFTMTFSNRVKLNASNYKFADMFLGITGGDNSGLSGITNGSESKAGSISESQSLTGTNLLSVTNALISKLGYISFGPTPPEKYGNFVGSWFGYDKGAKLSLYSSATDYMQWTGDKLLIKAKNFTLDSNGNITANNADLAGKITAASGKIGGWDIGSTRLSSGTGDSSVIIDSSGGVIPSFAAGSTSPQTAPFRVYDTGELYAENANISGSITATSGTIGGWNITTGSIVSSSETAGLTNGEYAFYAGDVAPENSDFYVKTDGTLHATSASISGSIIANGGEIGGWTITSSSLVSPSNIAGITDGEYAFYAGSSDPSSAEFSVTTSGALHATSADISGSIEAIGGSIGGWTITSSSIVSPSNEAGITNGEYAFYAGNATPSSAEFSVKTDGTLQATSADITGSITSHSGEIGGWEITETSIEKGYIQLNSNSCRINVGDTTNGEGIVIDGPGGYIQSGNYVDSSAGFKIYNNGDAEFNNVNVRGEIRSSVFKYDEISSVAGTIGVFKSSAVIINDSEFVDSGTQMTISTELPSNFEIGDIVRIKDNITKDVWVKITGSSIISGSQTDYYCGIESASAGGYTFKAGITVVNYGQPGDGYLWMRAGDSIGGSVVRPYYSVRVSGSEPWNEGFTEHVRLGSLTGALNTGVDLDGKYGIAIGDSGSYLTYDPTNGLRLQGNMNIGTGNYIRTGESIPYIILDNQRLEGYNNYNSSIIVSNSGGAYNGLNGEYSFAEMFNDKPSYYNQSSGVPLHIYWNDDRWWIVRDTTPIYIGYDNTYSPDSVTEWRFYPGNEIANINVNLSYSPYFTLGNLQNRFGFLSEDNDGFAVGTYNSNSPNESEYLSYESDRLKVIGAIYAKSGTLGKLEIIDSLYVYEDGAIYLGYNESASSVSPNNSRLNESGINVSTEFGGTQFLVGDLLNSYNVTSGSLTETGMVLSNSGSPFDYINGIYKFKETISGLPSYSSIVSNNYLNIDEEGVIYWNSLTQQWLIAVSGSILFYSDETPPTPDLVTAWEPNNITIDSLPTVTLNTWGVGIGVYGNDYLRYYNDKLEMKGTLYGGENTVIDSNGITVWTDREGYTQLIKFKSGSVVGEGEDIGFLEALENDDSNYLNLESKTSEDKNSYLSLISSASSSGSYLSSIILNAKKTISGNTTESKIILDSGSAVLESKVTIDSDIFEIESNDVIIKGGNVSGSSTPLGIPQANALGKIDASWLPDTEESGETGEDSVIPADTMILFPASETIPVGWTARTEFSDLFMMGDSAYNSTTYGAQTHTHTIPSTQEGGAHNNHSINVANSTFESDGAAYPGANMSWAVGGHLHGGTGANESTAGAHSHAFTSAPTDTASNYPAHIVGYLWISPTTASAAPVNSRIMDVGGNNYGEDWEVDLTFGGYFVKASPVGTSVGTAGANSHNHQPSGASSSAGGTHTHTVDVTSAQQGYTASYNYGNPVSSGIHSHTKTGAVSGTATSTHTHTIGATSTNTAIPPYIAVRFLRRTKLGGNVPIPIGALLPATVASDPPNYTHYSDGNGYMFRGVVSGETLGSKHGTPYSGAHAHTAGTLDASGDHSHVASASIQYGAGGGASKSVSTVNGGGTYVGSHAHNFSFTLGTGGSHTHALTSSSTGTSGSWASLPPFKKVRILIKSSISGTGSGDLNVDGNLYVIGNATIQGTLNGKSSDSDKLDGQDSSYYQENLLNIHEIELGYNNSVDYPSYIDFHTIADKKDYDARIIASGGNSSVGGATLSYNAAQHVFLGQLTSPSGDYMLTPSWATNYPTPTASSGTFTTVSCYARYLTIGKMRFYSGLVYIGDAGSATGTLRIPIPSGTPASMVGGKWVGSGYLSTNKSCFVTLLPTQTYLEVLRYDGATAIGTGVTVSFSIMYELA